MLDVHETKKTSIGGTGLIFRAIICLRRSSDIFQDARPSSISAGYHGRIMRRSISLQRRNGVRTVTPCAGSVYLLRGCQGLMLPILVVTANSPHLWGIHSKHQTRQYGERLGAWHAVLLEWKGGVA